MSTSAGLNARTLFNNIEPSNSVRRPENTAAHIATSSPHIVALNIRAGGGKRTLPLRHYLDHHDPEIVVLTEWRNNPSGHEVGAWAGARDMHCAGQADGGTANGIFIASKLPFVAATVTPTGGGAGVLMLARFDGFTLLACYFPQLKAKASFFARCAEIAADHASTPLLIVGDLNTGNQLRDRSEKAGRYFCADAFDGLIGEHGLHDLWRRTNGLSAREWTWLSRHQNGFRIDHAFANEAFVQRGHVRCVYDHRPRETGWTDHSALVIHR